MLVPGRASVEVCSCARSQYQTQLWIQDTLMYNIVSFVNEDRKTVSIGPSRDMPLSA